jgi:hypothetical protein
MGLANTSPMIRSLSIIVSLTAALTACGGDGPDPDLDPPIVVSITPANGAASIWLHDPIRIVFSEALHADSIQGVTLTGPAGEPIAATVSATSESELTVTVADDAAVVGLVDLALGASITDLAGNPLAETGATWQLVPWSRSAAAGTTPSIAVDASGRMVMARSVDGPSGRRVVASQWNGAGWIDLAGPLGARDAALPSIVFDGAGAPVVVWSEFPSQTGEARAATVEAARWNGTSWQPIASPGEGAFAAAARPPTGEPVIVYTTPAPLSAGTLLRVRVLDGSGWQMLAPPGFDIPATGAVVGLPQLIAVAPATPILAFADGGAGAIPPQVRIIKWTGSWSEVSPITLGTAPGGEINRVSIAARGGEVVVGYDTFSGSFGVHAVRVTGQTWEPLGGQLDIDPSADAQAPAVALDADGAPVVAWREQIDGNWRGLLARWNGAAWITVGGHVWSDDPSHALVRPALALLRDRVPIVAWAEQPPGANNATTVRAALWNGPRTASLPGVPGARASIAGCSFTGNTATLSATGCFIIAAGRATPHPGLVPFDLTSELWSDGALKRRWLALPDGQAMTAPATAAWTAPPGTLIIKEFAYETTPGAVHTRKVMETRFLINGSAADTWQGFTFRWRPDGSDADLITEDAPATFAWPLDSGIRHVHSYPSRTQCARCHHASNGPLLGLRTAQLARRFDYGGIIADQLDTLGQLGVIPAQLGRITAFASPHDTSLSLEARVRGYLAANCSHCHNPGGERATRDLRWETPLASTLLCGPDNEIVAGSPSTSVLVQRISTRSNGMPPLATLETDPLAIDIATRWIAGETNCP